MGKRVIITKTTKKVTQPDADERNRKDYAKAQVVIDPSLMLEMREEVTRLRDEARKAKKELSRSNKDLESALKRIKVLEEENKKLQDKYNKLLSSEKTSKRKSTADK